MDEPLDPPEPRDNVVQLPRREPSTAEQVDGLLSRLEEITSRVDAQEQAEQHEAQVAELVREVDQIRRTLVRHEKRLHRHHAKLPRYRTHDALRRARQDAEQARADVAQYQMLLAQAQSRSASSWSWGKVLAVLVALGALAFVVYRLSKWVVAQVKAARAAAPPVHHHYDQRNVQIDRRSFPQYDQRTYNTPERVRERVRVEKVPERTIVERQTVVQPTEYRTQFVDRERVVERQPIYQREKLKVVRVPERTVVERQTVVQPTKHTREVREAKSQPRSKNLDRAMAKVRKAASK